MKTHDFGVGEEKKKIILSAREGIIIIVCACAISLIFGNIWGGSSVRKTIKLRYSIQVEKLQEQVEILNELTVVLRKAK